MAYIHDESVFADRHPLAFSESHDQGGDDSSVSAVGLIVIAFVCLKAGAVMAFLGGFGILMSLLIGWLSSFVGLFAVIACIMLSDTLFGRGGKGSGMSADTDIEMERLRARWNQNVAMARVTGHGAGGGRLH